VRQGTPDFADDFPMATGTAGGKHTNRHGNNGRGGDVFTAIQLCVLRTMEAKVDGLSTKYALIRGLYS
jgi:hypothetical protein